MFQLAVNNSTIIKLHTNIFDILFKHKSEIFNKLSDLLGLHFIDHVALYLINPDHEIVIFSITPSVEFNLLLHGFWQFDRSFNPTKNAEGKILFWENAYDDRYRYEIKRKKEISHHFTLGFNLLKRFGKFRLIYAFATRYPAAGLHKYYQENIAGMLALGDYGYRQLLPIYQQYCNYNPPLITNGNARKNIKLIVNNS